jgi:hypothetical protein
MHSISQLQRLPPRFTLLRFSMDPYRRTWRLHVIERSFRLLDT